ncbi:MAG: glycine cleavage system protein GcvH [Sciscionella sp.]
MSEIPQNLSYTAEHEWIDIADGVGTVGITAYAAEALGDVVFVQLPEVGDTLTRGDTCGEVESTKSVSDLYAPVSGEVVEVNEATTDTPEVLNTSPFSEGWLFKVKVSDSGELLDAEAYSALLKQED